MDARKLVGMTEGAKKRYARSLPVERFCMSCKTPLRMIDEVEPTHSRAAQFIDPESMACPKCGSETDSLYPDEIRAETRAFYHIGQRLRPCPGCPDCVLLMQDQQIDGKWIAGRAVLHDRECSSDDPSGACCLASAVDVIGKCNGSGVLPAKKAKVRNVG